MFGAYPPALRRKLLDLRGLIFGIAHRTQGVGELTETLKWGQPTYLTAASKSGSTIRIGQTKVERADYAIYFHCGTTLIKGMRKKYGGTFRYEGNRAILFRVDEPIPTDELSDCVSMALTYHLDKKRSPTIRATMHRRRSR